MTAATRVFDFDSALLRAPAASVTHGLRALDRGDPSFEGVRAEHGAYAAALEAAGVRVTMLDALPEFPDSVFVEDPALVFGEGAILLRPGAPSREGEAARLAPVLRRCFPRVLEIADGHVDGGDVLVTPERVLIGLSARTDRAGASALVDCLATLGRRAVVVATPAGVLHLKSDCSLLAERRVLTTERLARSGIFAGFECILVPDAEAPAANALRVNDVVLAGAGYPATLALLQARGFKVVPLRIEQIARIDAGLSCMSLRWHSGR